MVKCRHGRVQTKIVITHDGDQARVQGHYDNCMECESIRRGLVDEG